MPRITSAPTGLLLAIAAVLAGGLRTHAARSPRRHKEGEKPHRHHHHPRKRSPRGSQRDEDASLHSNLRQESSRHHGTSSKRSEKNSHTHHHNHHDHEGTHHHEIKHHREEVTSGESKRKEESSHRTHRHRDGTRHHHESKHHEEVSSTTSEREDERSHHHHHHHRKGTRKGSPRSAKNREETHNSHHHHRGHNEKSPLRKPKRSEGTSHHMHHHQDHHDHYEGMYRRDESPRRSKHGEETSRHPETLLGDKNRENDPEAEELDEPRFLGSRRLHRGFTELGLLGDTRQAAHEEAEVAGEPRFLGSRTLFRGMTQLGFQLGHARSAPASTAHEDDAQNREDHHHRSRPKWVTGDYGDESTFMLPPPHPSIVTHPFSKAARTNDLHLLIDYLIHKHVSWRRRGHMLLELAEKLERRTISLHDESQRLGLARATYFEMNRRYREYREAIAALIEYLRTTSAQILEHKHDLHLTAHKLPGDPPMRLKPIVIHIRDLARTMEKCLDALDEMAQMDLSGERDEDLHIGNGHRLHYVSRPKNLLFGDEEEDTSE